jgi:hypothetical protein
MTAKTFAPFLAIFVTLTGVYKGNIICVGEVVIGVHEAR